MTPPRSPKLRRVVVEREIIGPFAVVRCDDGSEWLKCSLVKAGGFVQRRPSAKLTIPRLRELVLAIDAAPDVKALAELERSIVAQYVGDVAVRELLEWITRRARTLRDGASDPRDGPPAAA